MKISLPKQPDFFEVAQITEKLRKEKRVEHLYFVKRNKAFVWFEGARNYVSPQPEQQLRMKDTLVLHNHIDGTSFSFQDIEAITKYNAKELRVICKTRAFIVIRKGRCWNIDFDREEDINEYNEAFKQANILIDDLVTTRQIDEVERNDYVNHITWKVFFTKFEVEYKSYGL